MNVWKCGKLLLFCFSTGNGPSTTIPPATTGVTPAGIENVKPNEIWRNERYLSDVVFELRFTLYYVQNVTYRGCPRAYYPVWWKGVSLFYRGRFLVVSATG